MGWLPPTRHLHQQNPAPHSTAARSFRGRGRAVGAITGASSDAWRRAIDLPNPMPFMHSIRKYFQSCSGHALFEFHRRIGDFQFLMSYCALIFHIPHPPPSSQLPNSHPTHHATAPPHHRTPMLLVASESGARRSRLRIEDMARRKRCVTQHRQRQGSQRGVRTTLLWTVDCGL